MAEAARRTGWKSLANISRRVRSCGSEGEVTGRKGVQAAAIRNANGVVSRLTDDFRKDALAAGFGLSRFSHKKRCMNRWDFNQITSSFAIAR